MVAEQQERISRLEGAYEQVDKRLDDMNLSIDRLWTEINSLRNEMNSRFNNLYILIAGSWITLMAAIIGLYIKG
jgi:chromosome segregation ATPase